MICHFFCIKFWIQMFGVKSLLSCEIFKTSNISKIQNLWNFGFERFWTERVLFSQISKWFLVPFKGGVSYVLGACELVVGRCTCQLLFQWATRTTMWDMGPKKSKAHMGHLVQLKESMCQSHGLGLLILTILQHSALDASHFFWVLDIQNPCRMNAIWGLLLVGLAVTMEACSFVIWSHILANVHHVFLWTVECIFWGELHGNISYCHCCYLLFEVCNCQKGQIHSFHVL